MHLLLHFDETKDYTQHFLGIEWIKSLGWFLGRLDVIRPRLSFQTGMCAFLSGKQLLCF